MKNLLLLSLILTYSYTFMLLKKHEASLSEISAECQAAIAKYIKDYEEFNKDNTNLPDDEWERLIEKLQQEAKEINRLCPPESKSQK